jgi:hypothetical protein
VNKSKRISLVTIFAMLVSSLSLGVSISSANAATPDDFKYKTFQINGTDITGDITIDLVPGTSSVSLNVEGTDNIDPLIKLNGTEVARTTFTTDTEGRGYKFDGSLNGLTSGDNILTVEPKDDNNYGTPGFVTTVTLHVIPLLSSITVNGDAAAEGSTIELAANTSSVDVSATAVDPNATVAITGATGLVAGENTLTISVTNPDTIVTLAIEDDPATPDVDETAAAVTAPGLSFAYTITLNVAISTNTDATITVNGVERIDGEEIFVDYGTSSVDVAVTTLDANSTFFIDGDLGLATGDNDLVVTVTAADGTTAQEYHFNVVVHANTDTSVNFITVNGEQVADGDSVDVDPLTAEVDVQVDTTDIEATFTIDGDHDLVAGSNQLLVTVTAADGETEQQYFVTVNVLLNTDVSLSVFTVNGSDAADNDYITLDPLTTEVEVEVQTTDPDASFEIVGGTDLVVGENDLFVNVTAADGETTGTTYVVLVVAPNTDTSVESIQVNGEATDDGGVVYLDPFTTEVTVDVTTTDPEATFTVSGDTDLVVGENDLLITVTAADTETTQDYTITLVVAQSNDTSVVGINVTFIGANGEETATVSDGDEIELPSKTYSVDVAVETTESEATVEISGNTDLVVGENTMTVTVTAPDGETSEDYYVTLIVAVGDVTLSTFTVNENEVSDGDIVDLEAGTENVDIALETTDEDATYEITGGENLVLGPNTLTVEVTSVDGTLTVTYTVTLNVLPYDDATFSSIEVNGIVYEEGTTLITDAGDLDVVVYTNNEYSTVRVTGKTTNVSGFSQLLVEVTAQDGETVESATIDVLAASDMEVVPATGTDTRIGTWMKINRAQFPKAAKVTYSWIRDLTDTVGEAAKYRLTLDDFGHDLRAVVTIATKGAPDLVVVSRPVEVMPGLITKAPSPAIKGKAIVGMTLTASTKAWADGIETTFQWYRDGEAIADATSETYDVTAEDFDATITVGITGSMEGYEPLEKISTGVKIAAGTLKYTDRPGISGDFVTGGTVEVNPGSWLDGAEISIVWMRNGEEFQTTAADENTYVLTAEDYGTRLSVNIVVTAAGYKDATFKMRARTIKIGTLTEVPTPVINGDPVVGETLDADAGEYPEGAEFKYVWKRNGRVIHTAYDSSYTVSIRDIGATLTVKVIATIPGYKTTRVESEGVEVAAAQ